MTRALWITRASPCSFCCSVGEYLFDHRNANVSIGGQTFVEWFVEEYFGGPAGIGNKDIIGL